MHNRPAIEIILTLAPAGQKVNRRLLAETGAGNVQAHFEMLLDENDCLLCGGKPAQTISLGGAYTGSFPLYVIRVRIPLLGFDDDLVAVGVPNPPKGFDGIACFRFLNRFTYGNFGDPAEFALET
jgi:hypothetical protein